MSAEVQADHVPVRYWRSSLAEAGLIHPEVPPQREPIAIDCDEHGWFVARAPGGVNTWVQEQFASSKSTKTERPVTAIPFVLVPARLSEHASHGTKPEAVNIHRGASILCVPCLLDREGSLMPDPDRYPWIPREFLEPTLLPLSIGALKSYDTFISQLPRKAESFEEVLQAAADLLAAVASARLPLLPSVDAEGHELPILNVDGYELVSEWHGLPYDPPVIARHIIKLYDSLAAAAPTTPLFDTLRTISERPTTAPVALESAKRWYAGIVGHINTRYPLSPSQREAMVELVRVDDGQVVSVNGPPGTGKTTLLQDVVAHLWVDAALKEGECPLVVVTSTNAKAVENVLESFARIGADIGHRRWHPYQGGFGLFLASESRDTAYPTCTGVGRHPFLDFESAEGLNAVRTFYLESAAEYFGAPQTDIAAVVRALHALLRKHAQQLSKVVDARFQLFKATGQSIHEGATSSCRALLERHQADLDAAESTLGSARQTIADCDLAAAAAKEAAKSKLSDILSAEKAWTAYLAASPLWMDILVLFPFVRRRREARDRHQLLSNPLTAERRDRDDDLPAHFESLRAAVQRMEDEDLAAIERRAEAARQDAATHEKQVLLSRAALEVVRKVLERWLAALGEEHADLRDVSLAKLNDALDLRWRAPMFSLADWYWSGRWLLEMQTRLAQNERDSRGRVRYEAMYRRFAKLSPCLVSNFHMAPSFFTAWQGDDIPMWNAIDLLVVDEAGQVTPDVGAPMFALARRALVVGDIYQIEPVWSAAEGIDRVNATAAELTAEPHDPKYDHLARAGLTCAAGSLMHVANRACTVRKYPEVRGLMLTEHRRCVPELVSYCNELIYDGRLEPMRPSLPVEERLLPAFGYLDVRGLERQLGKSRENVEEAEAIVAWLKSNRSAIENHYRDDQGQPTPLWKLVGIVTPFSVQASAIQRVLRREMRNLAARHSRLTVGTVHALQGAERAIVIFSPTYGGGYQGGMFFDRTPNMLNVAVSRAKDSFLVIGNMELFDVTKPSRPSGLLGRFMRSAFGAPL